MLTETEARELTYYVALEWADEDRAVLEPLVDAALVWAEADAAAVDPVIDTLWRDGLREDLERALAEAAQRYAFVGRLRSAAEADLAAGPHGSLLARAVVEQGAFELAHDLHPFHCLLCAEDRLAATPEGERRSAVLGVARIAGRVAAVAPGELRAAIASSAADPAHADVAAALATDERRRAVRSWLENLARLGAQSVPTLSVELGAAVRGPLPVVADDQVWREAVLGLTDTLGAEWN